MPTLVSYPDIESDLVIDKRIAFESKSRFGIFKSAQGSQYNSYAANSSDNSSTAWVIPITTSIALSKNIQANYTFQVILNASTPGSNGLAYDPQYDGPNQNPIGQISNLSVVINSTTVSFFTQKYIQVLPWCNVSPDMIRVNLSTAPAFLDQTQNYSDIYNQPNQMGIANSPFGGNGQNSYYSTRGGWNITVISNTSTQAVLQFTSTEPLYASPFNNQGDDHPYFFNLNAFQPTNQISNLQSVWRHSDYTVAVGGAASVLSSMFVTVVGNPTLLVTTLQLTQDQIQQIPARLYYNYSQLTYFQPSGSITTLTAGQTRALVALSNIQLQGYVKRIIIAFPHTLATSTYSTTNTFLKIENLQINYNGQPSQLQGATAQQLYLLSRDAGLNMSWSQFSNPSGVGSIVILDIGKSLYSNMDNVAPGVNSNSVQLQITATVTNLNQTNSFDFTPLVITVSDGLFWIDSAAAQTVTNPLTTTDVDNIKYEVSKYNYFELPKNWFGSALLDAMSAMGSALIGGHLIGGSSRSRRHVRIEDDDYDDEGGELLNDDSDSDEGGSVVQKKSLKQKAEERKRSKSSKIADKLFK